MVIALTMAALSLIVVLISVTGKHDFLHAVIAAT
jgi:hypothetical protein